MELSSEQLAIIEALDLSELPLEEREQILIDLQDVFLRSSMLSLIERMDESARVGFENLLNQQPTEESILIFLKERVPEAESCIRDTIQEISDDILGVTGFSK